MDRPLIHRLTQLRRTIRLRLAAYGLCVVAAGGVVAFLTIITVDWMLGLPPVLRIITAGLFLSGFVFATLHWIVRPLQARFDLGELASRLESRFTVLQDRLVSAVNFIENGGTGSPGMMERVVHNTERALDDIRLESALTVRPLLLRATVMVASFAALLFLAAGSPDWIRTGTYRYVYPWGQIEWPRTVSIRPLTGDRIVAIGASVTVGMKIERGLSDGTRGIVRFRESNGSESVFTMKRGPDGVFHATIDAVTTDLTYWFEAGDDSTKRRSSVIQAVRRPEVVEAFLTIEPPPYAAHRPSRVLALTPGTVRAPKGGHVQVDLKVSKPIRVSPGTAAIGLRTETGDLIPLHVDAARPDRLSARVEVVEDLTFSIELRDEHGIENHRSDSFTIVAVPDRPPSVAIVQPGVVTEVTAEAVLALQVSAEDDFGLFALEWEVVRLGGDHLTHRPLNIRIESDAGSDRVRVTAREDWDLTALSLSNGEVLVCTATARDNRAQDVGGGQVSRSAPIRIKIISAHELDTRLRIDTAALEVRIRQLALDQAEVLDATRELRRRVESLSTDSTGVDHQAAKELAARQVRLARRTQDVAERFRSLRQRSERSRLADNDAAIRFSQLASVLQQTAAEPMSSASRSLAGIRHNRDSGRDARELEEAAMWEEAALDRLRFALAALSQWGGFHELLTHTRDLVDRQESIRTQTIRLGKSLIGKTVRSLTKAEASSLQRVGRQQEQLSNDVQQLLNQMKQAVAAEAGQLSSDRESVDAALRVGRARDVSKHAQTATQAVKANRVAAAAMAQRSTVEALRKMVAALQRHDRRRLDELRKRLERAQDQVVWLIRQQDDLRSATREADELKLHEELRGELAENQRSLKRNTRLLGDDLAEVQRSIPAGRLVRRAAKPMGDAETHLRMPDPAQAVERQDEALALLHEAVDRLDEAARETSQAALRRSLAQIREDLERLADEQQRVNEGISKLSDALAERGRMGRSEARQASKLVRRQHEVRRMLEDQAHDFDAVVVYQWALQRVAGWMDDSRARLSSRDIDDTLVATTERIVMELQKLIQAIVDTQSLPVDAQFVESSGGGGSQGQSAQKRPVPSVAELLVLKAMQNDVNKRTTTLYASVQPEDATESQLNELRMLAEDQKEIQRLAQLVTDRVRKP